MSIVKWLLMILLTITQYSYSQCAMCRVVAESSQDAGGTIANSLNTGILYSVLNMLKTNDFPTAIDPVKPILIIQYTQLFAKIL